MLRWETTLDEPDGWDIAFVHARVAGGQESVVATHTELTSGSERVTVWRIDAEGKVVDTRVLAEGDNLLPGRHVVITSDGTIVLGSFAGSPDWIYVYAPSGELRWDKTLPDTQALYDLDSASDGSIYTISSFDDGGQALEHLVERYAPDGAHVQSWVHEATSPDSLPGSAFLAVDRRDDIHVAGNYRRGTEVSLRLAKYSPEGELRWSLPWEVNPATGDELAAHDLIIAANGDALLTFDNPTEEHPDRCHIVAVAP